MKHGFFGGIHPTVTPLGHRSLTPVPLPPPSQVVLPLVSHRGGALSLAVTVGERVAVGTVVATGSGITPPVHASVSGTVTAVDDQRVTIENDMMDSVAPPLPPGELVEQVAMAGVVGMGGAAFPTAEKIRSAVGKVDTLILNGCECEPHLMADKGLLTTLPHQVVHGGLLLAQAVGVSAVVVAVEDNWDSQALQKAAAGHPDIQLKMLPARYPQGSERQLIQSVTGREVPPGGLPSTVGCAVFNVATAQAVYGAVVQGKPLTHRIVTVWDDYRGTAQNFIVPLGTSTQWVLSCASGQWREDMVLGGAMTGTRCNQDTTVTKATAGVLSLRPLPDPKTTPTCINCGRCVAVCPMKLQPKSLYRHAVAGEHYGLNRYHLSDCISCGSCSYVCPGRLPLVAVFRQAKEAQRRNGDET